jgi:hypothetical protein
MEKADTGVDALCITADLMGRDLYKSRAEVYVALRSHRPPGVAVPVNLTGRAIRCWVYLPPGSAGAWPSAPNGVQLLCKSEGWWSWYSPWQNVRPEWEGTWVELSANLADAPGSQDPQFDPAKVLAIGLKVAINNVSTATLQGRIYLDDYELTTDPPVTFDFEQLEVERDFLALHQVLARCAMPVVRVFILADGRAAPEFSPNGEVTGLDMDFFPDFDAMVAPAQQSQLLLLPVLLDFSWCNTLTREGGAQLGGHADIIRSRRNGKPSWSALSFLLSSGIRIILLYPRIVYTVLNSLRLLGAFGECQVMAQPVARRLLVSSLINKDFRGCYLVLVSGNFASATLNHQNWPRAEWH